MNVRILRHRVEGSVNCFPTLFYLQGVVDQEEVAWFDCHDPQFTLPGSLDRVSLAASKPSSIFALKPSSDVADPIAPTVVIMSEDPTLPIIPTLNIFPFAFPRLPPKSIPYFVLMSSLTFPSSIPIGLFTAATVWDRDSFSAYRPRPIASIPL